MQLDISRNLSENLTENRTGVKAVPSSVYTSVDLPTHSKPSESVSEVRFRCPSCQKLYCTNSDVFEGDHPEFDCQGCNETFLLSNEMNEFGIYATKSKSYFFVSCPKCSKLMPGELKECPSCGVFVEKYQQMAKSESPVLFNLNQSWKRVIENFNDDARHQEFLNMCQKKLALNFAFQKYDELRKAMNYDSKCEKYLNQIELRLEQQLMNQNRIDEAKKEEPTNKFYQKVSAWVAIAGLGVLVINRIRPMYANLNGLVIAITVLAFGLWLVSSQNKNNNMNL